VRGGARKQRMNAERVTTRAALLAAIAASWERLNATLNRLSATQMTQRRDAAGWTATDHVAHVAAWQRSAIYFLQGLPRHEALGLDEALYRSGDAGAINAAIRAQTKELLPQEARVQLDEGHALVLTLLQALSDEDLRRSYRHFLPEETDAWGERRAIDVVYANTAHHFDEHRGYIEALLVGGTQT
jgi:hypothetical protein